MNNAFQIMKTSSAAPLSQPLVQITPGEGNGALYDNDYLIGILWLFTYTSNTHHYVYFPKKTQEVRLPYVIPQHTIIGAWP